MQKQKLGHIINIASVAGFKVFAPGGTVYSATKFAVRALTEGLRMEHKADNIRCTITLRANISETVLVLLINEQGEKEKGRDERYFSWCSFLWSFGWRATERRRAKRATAQCSASQSGRRCGAGLAA
jgi:NAD(P)-dependent dehydrogenase (short-subunit alcohol dehydrogenase family)